MISAAGPMLDSGRRSKPDRFSAVGVAQLVELLVVVQAVGGSSPLAHPLWKPRCDGGRWLRARGVGLEDVRSAFPNADW